MSTLARVSLHMNAVIFCHVPSHVPYVDYIGRFCRIDVLLGEDLAFACCDFPTFAHVLEKHAQIVLGCGF